MLVILLLISCLLLLLGLLLLGVMAVAVFQFIDQGEVRRFSPSASRNLQGVLGGWFVTLSLVFGGNLLRSLAISELGVRRINAQVIETQTQTIKSSPSQVSRLITNCVALLVAPVMLFWGIFCAMGTWTWLRNNLPPGWTGSAWWTVPQFVGLHNALNACWWWLVAAALIAGSVGLFWIGFRSIMSPRQTETVP